MDSFGSGKCVKCLDLGNFCFHDSHWNKKERVRSTQFCSEGIYFLRTIQMRLRQSKQAESGAWKIAR
ncbi:unnamed protein product [Dibothriocephalus latus]|uniref:Uncharacterized protein n=1 Tax=Dibothriocephalus latus TaxID=60516 RepID=A0A3P6VFJ5_DIBLA|nr:unnamed protein product [Dibothriocephalus latus]